MTRKKSRVADYLRFQNQIRRLEERAPGSIPCTNSDNWTDWTSNNHRDQQRAALACQDCPLIRACLRYSLEHREAGGVWGGRVPRVHRPIDEVEQTPLFAQERERL